MARNHLDALLEMRDAISGTQNVELVEGPAGAWTYDGNEISNERSDFFRIVGHVSGNGTEHVFIRQAEHALVGLVTAHGPEGLSVLVNARAEPGLVGTTQFSSTIQSTPSNYLRRHGGAPTPFIDEILDPPPGARVIHDSLQFDWGEYYYSKVKRFRIVELGAPRDAPSPLVWVGIDQLIQLLRMDHLVTSDLRVASTILLRSDSRASGPPLPLCPAGEPLLMQVPLSSLAGWSMTTHGLESKREDREIVWVKTTSATREVASWIQPLMRLRQPDAIALPFRRGAQGVQFAVRQGTQPGLDGVHVWFPATPHGGRVVDGVELSAEGGRFYMHTVKATLVEADVDESDAKWVSRESLEAIAREPMQSSLELRCLLSLVQVSGAI